MKRLLLILLSLCMVIGCLAGCSHKEEPKVTDEVTQSTEEPKPVFPELEYVDVFGVMFGSNLGKAPEDCGIPEDSIFMSGDGVCGYDYVALGDIKGNLTCYWSESGVYSFIFGSNPYEDNTEFTAALNTVNALIAKRLGVDAKEPTFTGGQTEDAMTAVFEGKGVLICEYQGEGALISVTGCGVNGVATIAVECKTAESEG
ncbi:MAG: hypothetical protein IJO56_00815 [Oscillospiraceae bacterium]|nr:hypothetical protein [Oscillospiraceae bacterium]